MYTERKRTNEPLPHIAREELPKHKDRQRIRRIRRAIQHMDDLISKGLAGRDISPIGLIVKSDSIELDNEEISFEELASWIQQIYRVVERLVAYTPTS